MTRALLLSSALGFLACVGLAAQAARQPMKPAFHTSDRCIACHNGLTTSAGEDVSIGFEWRASMMANSSRDPYWQASVRRETLDHPEAAEEIEDTCARCHMPMERYAAKMDGRKAEVFEHLPFKARRDGGSLAEDGVSCSLCHQIGTARLGTPESFTGGFVGDPPDAQGSHREYGPYDVDPGHTLVMKTSTEGYVPAQSRAHRQSEICATCHTLITETLGPGGKPVGRLPEQVPYPGVAAQRLQGDAELPVVPHAGGQGTGADHARLRRTADSWRGTCSSAATSSCSACSTATAMPSIVAALPQ